jgi:hypothetical protein
LLAEQNLGAEKPEKLALLALHLAVSAVDHGHLGAEPAERIGGGET